MGQVSAKANDAALLAPAADSLPPLNTSITTLVLTTAHGKIRIALKPEWSAESVEFVRRLAQLPELCSNACEFYRAEPGFLLQVRRSAT